MGGLAAAAGLWAAKGDKKTDLPETPAGRQGSPRSSPELPETFLGPVPKHGKRASDPVILGEEEPPEELFTDRPLPVESPAQQTRKPKAPEEPKPPTRKKNKTGGPLKLPYSTDDIISRSSPHAYQRRSLTNAEALAKKDQLDEAIELYERVKKRVDDEEVRRKIDENIQSINDHAEGIAGSEDDISGPELLTPIANQALAMQQLAEGIKSISEGLIKQIDHAFLVHHVVSQGSPVSVPEEALRTPPEPGTTSPQYPPSFPQGAPFTPPMPPVTGEMAPASPGWSGAGMAKGGIFPSGLTINDEGEVVTRGWTDEDFQREWEKFRNLPLKDRRSGDDRRKPEGEDFGERDRRFEADRRKTDLFKERDEFLKHLDEHKKNKKLFEEYTKIKEESDLAAESGLAVMPSVSFKKLREDEIRLEVSSVYSDQFGPQETEGEDELKAEDLKPKEIPYNDPGLPEPLDFFPEPPTKGEDTGEFKEEPESVGPLSFSASEVKIDHTLEELEVPPLPDENLPEFPEPVDEKDLIPEPEFQEEPTETEEEEYAVPPEYPEPEAEDLPEPQHEEPRTIEVRPSIYDLEAIGLPDPVEMAEPEHEPDRGFPEGWPEPPGTQEGGIGATDEEENDFPELAPLEDQEQEQKPQVQEIRGVLELKPPDEEDAPYLTLTYDFTKIPDSFKLSKDYHTMEYAYYKYKPMLTKAQEFTRRKMLKNALNYYRVIKSQNIPPEFKRMINRNIQDITEYLEKYLMSR